MKVCEKVFNNFIYFYTYKIFRLKKNSNHFFFHRLNQQMLIKEFISLFLYNKIIKVGKINIKELNRIFFIDNIKN